MQHTENDEKQVRVPSIDLESQPLQPVSHTKLDENDDDPEVIFAKAVAEIDTQPLPRSTNISLVDLVQTIFCVSLIGVGLFGMVWQCITYPHTLVVLYAKEKPASVTATLTVLTRTLAPVTITRSAATPTTGTGHQDARAASGSLTFYNGNASQETIAKGTVITGNDGVQVSTDQATTIPAANPPYLGQATITATTLQTGSRENIHAYDMNGTVSGSVFVKNLTPFTGGRDARTYRAVAAQDVTALTSMVNETLTNAFTTAFIVRQGEEAIPTTCQTRATPTHQAGDEATSVTVTLVKTCLAVAYNSQQLEHLATAAFTATRPGAQYRMIGQVQTSIVTLSPFTVHLTGAWAFVLTKDDEQRLAERIAGETPDQARKVLQQTGGIAYASIPGILPPAMYINFLVLVGK